MSSTPTSTTRLGPRGAAVAAALGLVGGGALAACNFIVGAGSYSVGGDAAVADTGSMSSDTGSPPVDSGTGADTVVPRDSGTMDSQPQGDTGGPMPDAGGCGAGLDTTSASFQSVMKTCLLAQSCDPFTFQVSVSDCITEDYLHSIGTYACLTTITDCAGFTGCTGQSYATASQCPDGGVVSCDGNNNAINCLAGGGGSVTNCTKYGGTCGVRTDDAGAPTADCVVASSCSQPNDGTLYCSGTSLYTCVNGKGYGINCSTIDATCIANGAEGTDCYYSGPACSKASSYVCNGNVADWCTPENVTFAENCSSAGLTCTPNADGQGTALCLAPGCTSTDVSSCVESCSGTRAQFCVGGAPVSFNCNGLASFTTCSTFLDNNFVQRAYCL